jgi:ribonuclease BN (tRNA processing enzyme)
MELLFLGTGSAFTTDPENFQSNMVLIAASGRRLLIDCGTDIRWSLARQRLSCTDVTDIYISHLHSDHIGGLECIGFQTKFAPACQRPRLYIEGSLVEPLWDRSLRGGMEIVAGGQTHLDTFFDVRPLSAGTPFEWEGIQLQLVPTMHVSCPKAHMDSFGLMIATDGQRTFLTTDTQCTPEHLAPYYADADLIFHDCETSSNKTTVHAHYDEIAQLSESVRGKTWLYGYQPGTLPDAVGDGFLGFVRPGQSFELTRHPKSLLYPAAVAMR